jgi:ACS family D-galactonate transporter-like MFS transporter
MLDGKRLGVANVRPDNVPRLPEIPIVPSVRWTLVALLGAATFINYLDRGSLAVALPIISRDLRMGPWEQGVALSAFFWTYTAMQIPIGRIVDRYSIKQVYAVMFAFWSLAAAATGLVNGLAALLVCRVLLGIGESIYLPGGMKVVSLHFRADESALPAGLFDLGAKLGLAVGTAIDVWLLVKFGWRSLFFRTGLVGLLWLVPWLWLYPGSTRSGPRAARPRVNWGALATNRALVGMSIGFFCWDYFWYFIISWLPSYLYSVRGVSLPKLAIFGSLPYLIFGAAEGFGGWAAGALLVRGADLSKVTKGLIAAGFTFGLLIIPAALVESPGASLAFLFAAALSWIACANMLAILKICAPDDEVALWTGVQNTAGNVGGVLAPVVTGIAIARTGSYVPAFLVVSAILIVGIAAYTLAVPRLTAGGRTVR